MEPDVAAKELGELFPAVYLRFHARTPKSRTRFTSQAWAVLSHLAMAGPLTVGEMGRHFSRAQSVVSELVDGLEKKGLLERMRDAKDRRRTLVWLAPAGIAALEKAREVLSRDLVVKAMQQMTEDERTSLLAGMRALVRAAGEERRTR